MRVKHPVVPNYGSSPLSRGIPWHLTRDQRERRIIPALAGNTCGLRQPLSRLRDHPRSRGEYSDISDFAVPRSGSSPLSRGILRRRPNRHPQGRIIPALAGNTSNRRRHCPDGKDHPRSRGEYHSNMNNLNCSFGSSPLSRGIPDAGYELHLQTGIIPALAGNTKRHTASTRAGWDHPRSRGEYTSSLSSWS